MLSYYRSAERIQRLQAQKSQRLKWENHGVNVAAQCEAIKNPSPSKSL